MDVCVHHIPSPKAAAKKKVSYLWIVRCLKNKDLSHTVFCSHNLSLALTADTLDLLCWTLSYLISTKDINLMES